jgi:hypothetical protein
MPRLGRFDAGDAGADLDNFGRRLMPQEMRQESVDAFQCIDLVDLRAADRRVEHFDQHLAGIERVGQGDLVDHQLLPRLDQDRGAGLLDLHDDLAIRNR